MSRRFEDLVALQARLRSPEGCPWDREQTHETLRTYLLEETYEVLEAIEARDFEKLAGELGDLLLQIVFHAQLAQEAGRFDVADVIERIHTKLVRRHPHVFGDTKAVSAQQVVKNWEALKAEERQAEAPENADSILAGVPRTLPALLEAYQLTRRAANIGFDWDDIEGPLQKLKEETAELRQTLAAGAPDVASGAEAPDSEARSLSELKLRPPGEPSGAGRMRVEEEVGDLLFVAANVARFLGMDPEIALKKANRKFAARFREMEQEMVRRGGRLADASREEMEALWLRSKNKV